jgi:membrane protease YdiL (CAAX protease family)
MTHSTRPAPVASTRHTLIVLGIFAAITLGSARGTGGSPVAAAGSNRLAMYGVLLAAEWLLFYGVWRGLRAHGTPLSSIFGELYGTRRGRIIALVGGMAALPLVRLAAFAARQGLVAFGAPVAADAAGVQAAMAPHGRVESLVWVALSISAGVCEEFVYRGYLMRQFSAWLGGPMRGLLLSALVFGLGHAYQGPWQVILITLGYGVPLGALALLARGLGPAIVAHALEDLIAGLTGF